MVDDREFSRDPLVGQGDHSEEALFHLLLYHILRNDGNAQPIFNRFFMASLLARSITTLMETPLLPILSSTNSRVAEPTSLEMKGCLVNSCKEISPFWAKG